MSIVPDEEIGECKVFRVKGREIDESNLFLVLKKYSTFCKDKVLEDKKFLGQGSFGVVHSIKIDGGEYAIKEQDVKHDSILKYMETEVSISNYLSTLRREDGQRICVPIYECFFLVNKIWDEGKMFYIMDKGKGSIDSLIKDQSGIMMDHVTKVVCIRDAMVKMMENISIMVEKAGIVNWDVKPGNSIYNFREMEDTGSIQVNPILIDFDNYFCETDFSKIINIDKLNYIVGNILVDDSFVLNRIFTRDDLNDIFSFILQISYLGKSLKTIRQIKTTSRKLRDYVTLPFLTEARDNEKLVPLDIINILLNPVKKNHWLNLAFQIIMRTNLVDSKMSNSRTTNLRKQVYYYLLGSPPKRHQEFDKKYRDTINHFIDFYNLSDDLPKLESHDLDMGLLNQIARDSEKPEKMEEFKERVNLSISNLDQYNLLNNIEIPDTEIARKLEISSRFRTAKNKFLRILGIEA